MSMMNREATKVVKVEHFQNKKGHGPDGPNDTKGREVCNYNLPCMSEISFHVKVKLPALLVVVVVCVRERE